jgi:hypothetical protein
MNRRRVRIALILVLATVAAVVIAAMAFLSPSGRSNQIRDSWEADVQYLDESRTEAIALTANYSLTNDKTVRFVLHPPPSGRVPVAWKVSAVAGEITLRLLQGDRAVRSFTLDGSGCQVAALQPGATYSLEIRVAAPADGRVELAWREVQDCG